MGMGLETTETMILEIGGIILALGLVLITGGVVGVLLARRQYGAVFPLVLILMAMALLLWWEPLIRVWVSFFLLLIGYTWLLVWWRVSQQKNDLSHAHQPRLAREGGQTSRSMVGILADGIRRDHPASTRKDGAGDEPNRGERPSGGKRG